MEKGTGLSLVLTCFLWIKGTVSLVLYVFFVDKRHWPEFGIISVFMEKRHWPNYYYITLRTVPFGISTIKGTVLSLVLPNSGQ